MKMKKMTALLLAFMLFTAVLPAVHAETPRKKNTVMIYMCGTNLESVGRQGTGCLGDIMNSRFNKEEVNVVILAGGCVNWSYGYDVKQLTLVEFNEKERRPVVADTFPLSSMGDKDTLVNFLNVCYDRYPAERYDLVLWNHGGGPNKGVCQDALFKPDTLTIPELCEALSQSPFADQPLDLLAFHACLMGSAEVANALVPYARYMVAGEDSIYGLSYDWLAGMENDEDAWETAKRMVDLSYAKNGEIIQKQKASELNAFAAVNLSGMQRLLQAMDEFFPAVSVNLDEISFSAMSKNRRNTISFGLGDNDEDSYYDLVDLGSLVNAYRDSDEEKADAVISALGEAVYCHADPDCTGLTVYHPFVNKKAAEVFLPGYNNLHFSEGYTDYINRFTEMLLSEPYASYANMAISKDADKSKFSSVSLALTQEQLDHFGAAELLVLCKTADGAYQFVNAAPPVHFIDQNNILKGEFEHASLYAVSQDGRLLSGVIEYTRGNNGLYCISAGLDGQTDYGEPFSQQVRIACELDADGKRLVPVNVEVREESGFYTPAYEMEFTDYSAVRIFSVSRLLPEAEGALPSFWDWESAGEPDVWSAAIDDTWHFEFVGNQQPEEDLYIAFQVTDSQNNRYSSQLLPLKAPVWEAAWSVNNDEIETVELHFLEGKKEGESYRVSAVVSSKDEAEVILNVVDVQVNHEPMADITATVYGMGMNWGLVRTVINDQIAAEEQPMSFTIPLEAFSQELDGQEISFALEVINAVTGEILGHLYVDGSVKADFSGSEEA
ncbi:MAG: hypothetical protein IK099_07545 [Clostridia bacterium]|nr:hypothetical protein [Clostridia bacterium]